MYKKLTVFALSALFATASVADSTVRTLEEQLPLEAGDRLDLDLPVGELRVTGTSSSKADFSVEVECSRWRSRCDEAAEDLEIQVRRRGDRVRVELDGWPRWGSSGLSVTITANVPHSNSLAVDMGVGQVTIEGLTSDLNVDVGVGEVEIEMNAANVRSVNLESGIGETTVSIEGERISSDRAFLGDEVRWSEGSGDSSIRVDVGIGAIDLVLD